LYFTDDVVSSYDPRFKVNPPLRSAVDVAAVRAGLADGTIDVVATDHAPHPAEDKDCEWQAAAFGMTGLESALAVVNETMVVTGLMDWAQVADRMSTAPARIARLTGQGRPIAEGEPAHLVVFQPSRAVTVDPAATASASRNTPYAGRTLTGKVMATFYGGRPTVLEGELA
jgi:dihydroorotase